MPITFNFLNNGPNGPTIYYDYPMSQPVSSSSPATMDILFSVSNPLSTYLYGKVSGSVTLASGSTAVCSISNQVLGVIPINSTPGENIYATNLNISAYPSTTEMNEVETVNITVSLYTDSEYTQLYETDTASFRLDFINSNNSNFTKVIDYDGNTTPSVGFSGISSLYYATSPVLVNGGNSIEVNTGLATGENPALAPNGEIPSGTFAYFNNNGGIINSNGVYNLIEFFINNTGTYVIPGSPFNIQNQNGIINISNTYFNTNNVNEWQIFYISVYSNNYGVNTNYNFPSFTSSETGTYYIGFVQVLESTTNFL